MIWMLIKFDFQELFLNFLLLFRMNHEFKTRMTVTIDSTTTKNVPGQGDLQDLGQEADLINVGQGVQGEVFQGDSLRPATSRTTKSAG